MSLPSADLVIYKKTDALLEFVYPLVVNFPKAEKFALSQEIKQALYAAMRSIMLANNIRHKRRQYQEEVDAYLKLLLVLFGVAKKQKYITQKKNVQIQQQIAEIGRILGGWMKSNK